jgi:hypothetical protein
MRSSFFEIAEKTELAEYLTTEMAELAEAKEYSLFTLLPLW